MILDLTYPLFSFLPDQDNSEDKPDEYEIQERTKYQCLTGFYAVINSWNLLPEEVVPAPSINSFKRRLNTLRSLLEKD